MNSIGRFIVLVSLLTVATQANASPVLLGRLSIDSSGFGIFGSAEPLTGMSLGFVYDFLTWQPGQPCLGCGIVWTDGQTGQVDFNAANNPFFSTFASRLTNGVNEFIGVESFPIFPTPEPGFFGVGNPEAMALGGSPDFIGHHVDLIRLTMIDVDITVTPRADGRFNNEVKNRFNWEFYEEVPEPASVTLLLCGAVMACSVRNFRRRLSRRNLQASEGQESYLHSGGRTNGTL